MNSPEHTSRQALLTQVATLIVFTLGPIFFLLMPQYVGALVEDVGLSARTAGNLASIELLGAALASVTALIWIRKAKIRWVIGIGSILLILTNLASIVVVDSYPLLAGFRLLSGFLAVSVMVIAVALLGALPNPDRGFALGVSGQLVFSGFFMVLLPGPIETWGVDAVFATFMVSAGLAGLAGVLFLPATVRSSNDRPGIESSGAWRKPVLALIGTGIFFFAQVSVWTYLELVGEAQGLSDQFIGLVIGLSTIASVGAALGAAWLSSRTGRFWPMVICALVQIVLLTFLLGSFSVTTFAVVVLCYSICWNLWVPFQMGLIAEADTSGKFVVLMPFFQAMGTAGAPALVAVFLTGQDYNPVMWSGMIFAALSLAVFMPLIRRGNSQFAT